MDRTSDLRSHFQEIERRDFELEISVESGFQRMISRIASNNAVREAINIIKADKTSALSGLVLDRIRRLSIVAVDPRYRNQNDTALAAYLLLLGVAAPEYLRVGIRLVGLAANTWIAKKTAFMLGRSPGILSEATEFYSAGTALDALAETVPPSGGDTASHFTDWIGINGSVIGAGDSPWASDISTTKNVHRYLSALATIGPKIISDSSSRNANVSSNQHAYLSALSKVKPSPIPINVDDQETIK